MFFSRHAKGELGAFYQDPTPWDDAFIVRTSEWANSALEAWSLTGIPKTPLEFLVDSTEGVDSRIDINESSYWLPPRRKQELMSWHQFPAPGWIAHFVPGPFRPSTQCRAMLALGVCVRGDLVRLPSIEVSRKEPTMLVSGQCPPIENACRLRWRDGAKVSSRVHTLNALLHVGTGLFGALDGAIDSPYLWAPDLAWKQLTPSMIALGRLLWGPIDMEGRQSCKHKHQRMWFVDYDRSVMPVVRMLAALKRVDSALYTRTCVQLVVDAFMSMGTVGWMQDELERGNLKSPYDAVDIVTTMAMFDNVCTQFERRLVPQE